MNKVSLMKLIIAAVFLSILTVSCTDSRHTYLYIYYPGADKPTVTGVGHDGITEIKARGKHVYVKYGNGDWVDNYGMPYCILKQKDTLPTLKRADAPAN